MVYVGAQRGTVMKIGIGHFYERFANSPSMSEWLYGIGRYYIVMLYKYIWRMTCVTFDDSIKAGMDAANQNGYKPTISDVWKIGTKL